MTYRYRKIALTMAGVMAVGIAVSGYATPWFGSSHTTKEAAAPAGHPPDLKEAAIAYLNDLCKLPKEQRDETFREVNEALLPNHATLSCGAGGER